MPADSPIPLDRRSAVKPEELKDAFEESTVKTAGPTVSRKCVIKGTGSKGSEDGMFNAMVGQRSEFTIEARDAEGTKQTAGGEKFMVSVRGSSQVRAKVIDKEDGTYTVEYKPSTSGTYSISVTLNGVPLPDSPLKVEVLTPAPSARNCVLKGDALSRAKAREVASFEVEFIDALGQASRAEELDVWVERVVDEAPSGGMGPADAAPAPAEAAPAVAEPMSRAATERTGGDAKSQRAQRAEALARAGGRIEVGCTTRASYTSVVRR